MFADSEKIKLLDKIIRISNSTVDVERRIKNILQALERELGADGALFFQLDRFTGALTIRYPDNSLEAPKPNWNLEDNFIGQTALKRAWTLAGPEKLADLPPEWQTYLKEYSGLASFPILDDQHLYGVLVMMYRHPRLFDEELAPLVETIAREMAGTIRNSRLYKESKKVIAELSVLYEVGKAVSSTLELDKILATVVNVTSKVLLAEGCSINVWDLDRKTLRVSAQAGVIPENCHSSKFSDGPAASDDDPVWECVNRSQPKIQPSDIGQYDLCGCDTGKTKSIICLPLFFKSRFKGALSVFNKIAYTAGMPKEFGRDDLDLLTTMGALISSSLENALTFQAAADLARSNERLVRNLSCLYEISGAMMTTVKMDEILDIIINALILDQGLGFNRALVMVVDEEGDSLMGAALGESLSEKEDNECRPLADLLRRDVFSGGPKRHPRTQEFKDFRLPLVDEENILTRTVMEKKTLVFNSAEGPALADSLPLDFCRHYYASAPMPAKGAVVGVIAVDKDLTRQPITEEDQRNLSMLAYQAGLAIENSRLYEYIEHANLSLSQARDRLLEAEKLAALGEMAAGMAHEIRNPLVSIGGFTRRMLKNLEPNSPHRVYVEVIINEVARLEKTLHEVLNFTHDTLGNIEECNINDVVSEALYVLRRDFKEGQIEVTKEFGATPNVLIDERQIKHVFFNLFYNALQAMKEGGILFIKTFTTQIGDRSFAACEVTDTGPGIPIDIMPNIFNPFYTTKVSGTGLGLSIVHKIIHRHHGEIDVVNVPEGGASFTVKLPAAAESGLYLT